MEKQHFFYISLLLVFIIVYTSMSEDTIISVNADPPLTIIDTHAARERCDVSVVTTIGFRIVNSSDYSPFYYGKVKLNDRPGQEYTNAQGWCFFKVYSNEVGLGSWSVESIHYGDTQLLFQQAIPDPEIIFDRVIIELETPTPRIGINTPAIINYNARYAYDDTPFLGEVILNRNELTSQVGKKTFTAIDIEDEQYGITKFETNTIDVIYDKVVVFLTTNKMRVDVGTEADIDTLYAIYLYDKSDFQGSITLNDTTKKDIVGKYCYSVADINDGLYNVNPFASDSIEIVFDEVIIDLQVEDDRINIGDEANISITSKYAYDSQPFEGQIKINDNYFKSNSVGSKTYYITEIVDNLYNLEAFSADNVEVIWDRINVELKAGDHRINVGDEAEIEWSGYYEYDKSDFGDTGTVILNSYNLSKDAVGDYTYEVSEVIDDIYGLSRFTSNPITIVWDEVNINIAFENVRLEAGTGAHSIIQAEYAYDRLPFEGAIALNDTLVKNQLKKYTYTASSINDPKYGITKFTSNKAFCVYDRIVIEKETKSTTPGSFQISVKLFFESDKVPVDNAEIIVNEKTAQYTGDGRYYISLPNWNPQYKIQAEISYPGFSPVHDYGVYNCVGNVGALTSAGIFSCSTILIFLRNRKMRFITNKLIETANLEEMIAFDDLSNRLHYPVKKIIKTTEEALLQGKISGAISFDNKKFISELELKRYGGFYDLTSLEIIENVKNISSPKIYKQIIPAAYEPEIHTRGFKFDSTINQTYYNKNTLLRNTTLNISVLEDNMLHPTFIQQSILLETEFVNLKLLENKVTCSQCEGKGWFASYRKKSKYHSFQTYNHHICPKCLGKGSDEISQTVLYSGSLKEINDFSVNLINSESFEYFQPIKIMKKRFAVGKKILESTPSNILDFDHTLPNREIVYLSPNLFPKEYFDSVKIVDGAIIPIRSPTETRTKDEKDDSNNHEYRVGADSIYQKKDSKKAGAYRKRLRGR